MSTPQPWFADAARPFAGDQPFFYDAAAFPWVAHVEAQWTTIRDELLDALAREQAPLEPYMDASLTSRPDQWKTLGLMFWTLRSRANCRRFPRTWAALRDVPGLCAVSLNLLEGGTTIKPHMGNTDAIIRCHLGLVVPEPAPRCAFRVGSETRSWDEGRLLMFCDAHPHTAWNNSDRRRYILVLDVMRPEYAARRQATSARVLAAIHFETACQRHGWLRRLCAGPRRQAAGFALYRAWYRWVVARHAFASALADRFGRDRAPPATPATASPLPG
jgi:aspartyl/asparaginyl beta-hydroxylase (cupin superfamily)